MDYIASLNTAPSPNFVVIVDGSETAIVSNVREGTLTDHGLIGPVQLYVTWMSQIKMSFSRLFAVLRYMW